VSTVPPGWYADPQNSTQLRFWSGEQWSEQTQPAPMAMAPTYGAPGQPGPADYGYPAPPVAPPPVPAAPASAWHRNQVSAIAVIFCVVYLGLAFSTHFVILGIAPLLMTIRAFRRREPLAALALVLTIITLGVSLTALAH
jgi:hypothetical protein